MNFRRHASTVLLGLPLLVAGCAIDPEAPTETSVETSDLVIPLVLTNLPSANSRVTGISTPNELSPELMAIIAAQGSNRVENPQVLPIGSPAVSVTHYGFDSDGPHVQAAGDVQTSTHQIEATKTEPDKNTYLVLAGQDGADPTYDYGTHFLFQGHENGARHAGTITRINLDADAAHRVTVMAVADINGVGLPPIDGSTWDPFAQRLLFTAELGAAGGVWQATLDVPSAVEDISGALGRAAYEGIQNDRDGSLWMVEDVGGVKGVANPNAKQPNSFVYRFVPVDRSDLHHGKLQALQVTSLTTGQPIAFHAGQADADITSADVRALHTYGNSFQTHWITLHDTEIDGATPFDANARAKALLATPFKRPENGAFRPGSNFKQFVFTETGDTDNRTEAGAALGGFGAALRLTQPTPAANTGTLSLVYLGDQVHTGFDNIAFWDGDRVAIVEDAGDTLHGQRNALDSAYLLDLTVDYSNPANQPARFIAEGRDPAATLDAGYGGLPGYQNDGDNELTGIHISNGDPLDTGILGKRIPNPFHGGYRVFFTQQHGENITWEVLPRP